MRTQLGSYIRYFYHGHYDPDKMTDDEILKLYLELCFVKREIGEWKEEDK